MIGVTCLKPLGSGEGKSPSSREPPPPPPPPPPRPAAPGVSFCLAGLGRAQWATLGAWMSWGRGGSNEVCDLPLGLKSALWQ